MALKYDGTINAGAILQAVVVFAGALSAVIWTQAGIWRLEADQRRMEATLASDLSTIRSDASAREPLFTGTIPDGSTLTVSGGQIVGYT